MSIKAIAVDDESHCLDRISDLLRSYAGQIDLIGTASTVSDGISMISKLKPNLVFLDIDIDERTGFDLLEALPERNFKVIFTTAYSELGFKAFRFSAVDFLVKPIDADDFADAIEKVTESLKEPIDEQLLNGLIQRMSRSSELFETITIPHSKGIKLIKLQEIVRIEAQNNISIFHMKDGDQEVAGNPLKYYSELLEGPKFFRVHQSHLVNIDFMKEFRNSGELKLLNGDSIPVSSGKKKAFTDFLRGL